VVAVSVKNPYPLDQLRKIAAADIKPRLERLPGIATADVAGGLEREIHVVLDPARLEAFSLDVNTVIGAIYRENTQVPGGSIEQGSLDFTIKTYGKYRTVKEIGEVLVGMKPTPTGMEPVRLHEVADVEDTFYESQRIIEVDGTPSVWMIVRKQSGANTVRAVEAVMEALPRIKRESGSDIDFKILFDQAEIINLALGNLSTTAMAGVLISFLVLLFFLRNLRSALIVSTAIPLSVIATFFVMDQANMTLNILSMAGLALAVGMLVDNAIVVLENIFRLRQEGKGAWEAAIQGARDVGTAVTASTLTTISVFIPVLFVPGIAGVMFKDMAVTICFALSVSLIVALTFIPLATSRLLGTKRAARLLERAHRRDPFDRLRNWYGGFLDWILSHRWVVGVGLVAVLVFTGGLMAALPTEFITEDDHSQIFVQVETPIGNNLNETYKIMKEVVDHVDDVVSPEERKLVALDAGVGKGFVAIFSKGVHAGIIRVPLVSMGQRERSQKQIEDAIREELKKVPGIKVTVAPPFNPMGGEGDIEIQIRGHNLQTSRRIGLELQEKLSKMPEMSWVNFSMEDQKPEVRVTFDRKKLAQLGISSAAAGNAISAYFMGKVAGRYAEGGDEFDIVVRYAKEHRLDINELRRMPVATPAGTSVPLQNIADVREALGPVDITRLDQGRVTRLICELKDAYLDADGKPGQKDLGGSIGRVKKILDDYQWPGEFTPHIGGTAEDFMTSISYLMVALLVSVLLVFMVMASQFESLRQPFIILFSVPLAAIGVVLMFTLTRSNVDVSAMVGIIMLVGIVVNNGIVMIDAANQFRQQGRKRTEAIAQASRLRMRPVLMTSLTTILAMTPLALEIGEGSAGWGAMAKAVIGGLLAATVLTLIVVPTMYTLFARKHLKHTDQHKVIEDQ
jgi:HAE1 family hydrophobic/amphiphilic exporter-1